MKFLKLSIVCAVASINCACADRVYYHPHRGEVIVADPVVVRDRVVVDSYVAPVVVNPVFEESLSRYSISERIEILRQQIEKLRFDRNLHPKYSERWIEIDEKIHNHQKRIRELEGY